MENKKKNLIFEFLSGFVLLLQTGLLFAVYQMGKNSAAERVYLIYLELIAFTVLFDMMLIIVRMVQRKKDRLREQIREQQFAEKMNQKQYQARKEMKEDTERLKQCLQQKLDAVKTELATGTEPAADSEFPGGQWDSSFCANAIVNAVLRDKSAECARQGIVLEHQVILPQDMRISEYHLCSVFANLLDNAIEACLALPERQRRILVQSGICGDYLCIRVRNSCRQEYAKRPKREGRGLGLGIVRKIAKEYDGELSVEVGADEFLADVMVVNKYFKEGERKI